MAHFAKLNESNIVTDILVISNDELNPNNEEKSGIDFLKNLFGNEFIWVQTSFSGRIRKNYAGIGYLYDSIKDAFIPPKCHEEAILNENTCLWDCNNDEHDLKLNYE